MGWIRPDTRATKRKEMVKQHDLDRLWALSRRKVMDTLWLIQCLQTNPPWLPISVMYRRYFRRWYSPFIPHLLFSGKAPKIDSESAIRGKIERCLEREVKWEPRKHICCEGGRIDAYHQQEQSRLRRTDIYTGIQFRIKVARKSMKKGTLLQWKGQGCMAIARRVWHWRGMDKCKTSFSYKWAQVEKQTRIRSLNSWIAWNLTT